MVATPRHLPGRTHHTINGQVIPQPASLLIEVTEDGTWLFRLDEAGTMLSETWHLDIPEAQAQAEFEYDVPPGEWRVDARRELVKLGSAFLEGKLPLVEAVTAAVQLQRAHGLPDDDLLPLAGIESELDEFPLGRARAFWDAAALAEKDAELARYLEAVRPVVTDFFRKLVESHRAP